MRKRAKALGDASLVNCLSLAIGYLFKSVFSLSCVTGKSMRLD